MKEKLRKILMVCFGVIFVCSMGMFIYRSIESKKGADIYSEAEQLAGIADISELESGEEISQTEDSEEESGEWKEEKVSGDRYKQALEQINLEALREVNEDVLGWIYIPNTPVSYPMVQSEDNQYYLYRTWNRESSIVGSVFLECLNAPDLSDFHTIVYAHHMMDGSMFGSLRNYKDQTYWGYHPFVYIYDDNGGHRYEIFSAYEADVTSNTYLVGFKDETEKQAFLDECVKQSVIQTNVVPTLNDRILTLSTCTNTGGYATRWVVQARLKGME